MEELRSRRAINSYIAQEQLERWYVECDQNLEWYFAMEMEEWLGMLTWGAAVERAIHQGRDWTSGYRFGEAKNPGPANERTTEDEIRVLLTHCDAPVWQILEVAPDSTMEERKRQYYVKMFKVHRDDCQHPQAQAAVHIGEANMAIGAQASAKASPTALPSKAASGKAKVG